MDSLQYTIDVDDAPAQAGTARVNRAFDTVSEHARIAAAGATGAFATASAAIVAAAGHTERAFTAAGHAAQSATHFIAKGTEVVLAGAASFYALSAAVAHYGVAAGSIAASNTTTLQSLVNLGREARLTVAAFAGSAAFITAGLEIAAVVAAEKTLSMANSRARLIERQAILAAGSDLKLEGSSISAQSAIMQIQKGTYAASFSGRDYPTVFKLQQALSKQFESSPGDTRSALKDLGVSNYYQGVPSVATLKEVAEGFDRMVGAENRASAAAKLFGKENVGEALAQLTPRLAESIGYVEKFNIALNPDQQHHLDRFRKDLLAVKDFFTDFSYLDAFGAKVASVLVNMVGAADDALHRLDDITITGPREKIDKAFPVLGAVHEYVRRMYGENTDSDIQAEASKNLTYGNKGIKGFRELSAEATTSLLESGTPALLAQARAAKAKRDASEDGIGDLLSAAKERRDESLKRLNEDEIRRGLDPNDKKVLGAGDRLVLASAAASSSQSVELLEAQQKSVKNSKEITKHQQEALRQSQELVFKSAYEPNAGRDLRGEVLKGTQFVNGDGEVVRFRLLDETRRNLEVAFHRFAVEQSKKASDETLKLFREEYDVRRNFDADLYQKRLAFTRQTLELEIASDDKVDAHRKELLAYRRDERLGRLEFDRPQTVSGKLGAERQKLAIEQDFLLQTSIADAERIAGDRDRKLADVAGDRFNNKITDAQYFDRVKAVQREAGVQGTALNDKFVHDNITAQQAAANASVQIVRDAQLKEFDSLKNSVEGVLNSMETRGVGVFQAIANSAKVSFLAAFNQIISSQIAATLFRILNPGQTVDFDHSGQGKGKFAGILGGLGLGTQPVFGGEVPGVTVPLKSNTDATDRNTAAIQGLTNAIASGGSQASQGQRRLIPRFGSGGSFPMAGAAMAGFGAFMQLAPGLGFGGGASGSSQGTAIDTTINYATGGSESFGSTSMAAAGMDGGSYASGGEVMGLPTGYSLPSAAGMSIPGVGGASGAAAGGGFNLNMAGLRLLGSSLSKGISNFDMNFLNGAFHPGNTVGLAGNLSQLGHSQAALLGGGLLVADGLKRGGTMGTLEDTAGGALVGFKFGGPIGAAIGAAAGLATGLIRQFFFPGDRQHAKDLVKQIYGLSINNATADSIVQLAKQTYGGQISVAVRSQEVRDLLKLYAESIGSPSAKQFVGDRAHSASLVEFGGKLQQGAVYDNGQAYTYSSGLPTLNGIGSSALPTIGRYAGGSNYNGPVSVSLDPAQTEQLWKSGTAQGIQDNPRLVASAAVNGYGQSAGSSGNRAAVLSPSAIDR